MGTEQSTVMERNGFLSAARAAQLMRCTVYTIYRWVKKGEIRGARLAGHWYVEKESLRTKAKSETHWDILLKEMEEEDSRCAVTMEQVSAIE